MNNMIKDMETHSVTLHEGRGIECPMGREKVPCGTRESPIVGESGPDP